MRFSPSWSRFESYRGCEESLPRICKWTDEQIIEAVLESESLSGVLRFLNVRQGGGSFLSVKSRIVALNLDTSHFLGQAHGRGKSYPDRKKPITEILCLKDPTRLGRERTSHLRRAMLEVGVSHVCDSCGQPPEWQGKALVLDIDHIDGNWHDDRIENLRFLCPNCHSQQETSKSRNTWT